MFRLKAWIAVVLIVCLILPACGRQEQTDSLISEELIVPEKTEYKTFTVTRGSLFNFTTGRASLEYLNSRELTWEVANSFFGQTLVEDGAAVKRGDVLMTFYSQVNQMELDAQRLQLIQRKQEVYDAKTAKRAAINEVKEAAKELTSYERKIADLEVEILQLDYDKYVYETDIEIAEKEAEIADMEKSMEAKELVAPFDGRVEILSNMVAGQQVDTSKKLIKLYSFENYFIVAGDEQDLRYNMEVFVDIGGDQTCSGRVITAENVLPSGLSSKVRIVLDEYIEATNISKRPMLTAYPERIGDVVQIDSDYIVFDGTKRFVYILDGDVVRKRYIAVGMTNRKAYWVLNGLSEGQTIING